MEEVEEELAREDDGTLEALGPLESKAHHACQCGTYQRGAANAAPPLKENRPKHSVSMIGILSRRSIGMHSNTSVR